MSSMASIDLGTSTTGYLLDLMHRHKQTRKPLSKVWQIGMVCFLAVFVNLMMVFILCKLNAISSPALPEDIKVMQISLDQQNERLKKKRQEPQEEIEPETLTVQLDMPQPPEVSPELIPLEFNLAMPTISPVMVSMIQPVQKVVRKTVVRKVAPTPPAPSTPQTMNSDSVDSPPRELAGNPKPVYPQRDLNRGRQGSVTLKLLINEYGRVDDVVFIKRSGTQRFVDEAMKVIRSYRFTPARHQGKLVRVWGIKTIRFRIGD